MLSLCLSFLSFIFYLHLFLSHFYLPIHLPLLYLTYSFLSLSDYAPAPELDYYDPELLAGEEEEVHESYAEQVKNRLAAEAAIEERERRRRLRDNFDTQLERVNRQEQEELDDLMREENEEDFLFQDDEDGQNEDQIRARMLALMEGETPGEGEQLTEESLNLERFEGSLTDWITEERTRREIYKRLKKFLSTYYDGIEQVNEWLQQNGSGAPLTDLVLPSHLKVKAPLYPQKIRHMCSRNSSSLEVSYPHLAIAQPLLAVWLTDCPREIINIFDMVLKEVVMTQFPHYARVSFSFSLYHLYRVYLLALLPSLRLHPKFLFVSVTCHSQIVLVTSA